MAPTIREIIGFDLGHGETALAQIFLDTDSSCKLLPINGRTSQVTAFARLASGEVVLGEDALWAEGSAPLDIAFKAKPASPSLSPEHPDALRWQRDRDKLKIFAQACYKALVGTYITGGEVCQVIVGCPSGWTHTEVEQYQQVFEEAGLPHVQVIQESRAAFIFARESGLLSQEQLKDAILLIDVGSSTTDLTYIKGLHIHDEPVGHQLGAGLIDEALLHINLARQPEIEAYFQQYPPARNRCLLACRRAKEEYFTGGQRAGGKFEDLNDTLTFTARVNDAMMDRCLHEPLAALDGRSWADTYRGLLEEMRAKLERDAQRDNLGSSVYLPKHILLTGGASRMPLIRQICLTVFPECSTPLHEAEPQFCVAKGLAEFARWRHRVDQFRAEVKAFYEPKSIQQLVEPYVWDFAGRFLREAVDDIFEKVVRACIHTWRQKQTMPKESIILDCDSRLQEWQLTASVELKRKAFSTVSRTLETQLDQKANAVFLKWQIPQKKITFPIDPEPFDLDTPLKGVMDEAFGQAADWLIKRAAYYLPDFAVDAALWGWKQYFVASVRVVQFMGQHVPGLLEDSEREQARDALVLQGCLPSLQEQIKAQFEQAAQEAEVYITIHRPA